MKGSFIKTKERAEDTAYSGEQSAGDYATSRISQTTQSAARYATSKTEKLGRQGMQKIGQTRFSGHEKVNDLGSIGNTFQDRERIQSPVKAKDAFIKDKSVERLTSGKNFSRSLKRPRKTIKTSASKNIKTAGQSIKSASTSAKVAVKSSRQTAYAIQKTVKNTTAAAQKSAQAAKAAARVTGEAVKAAGKAISAAARATIAGVKALISAIMAGGWAAAIVIIIVILFGAIFVVTGGNNDLAYTPVSAEVQAYEPLIMRYAKEHGIGEYVPLIKAVMMQESGGRGSDPMQASECGFNTRFPNSPNGITDPEYSVNVGIQNLAACLNDAEAKNPIDMERIKLALQGYNFGNGYITWAKQNHGGYSYANAQAFSQMMAERSGSTSYGDVQYVTHVLRYYPFGKMPTGGGNSGIVQVATSQLGNVGGQPYWSWYGFSSRQEWCACFVSWCAEQLGYIEAGIVPKFALCETGSNWFKSNGLWQGGNYEPTPGDIIFFDYNMNGSPDHVGIVEKCEGGTVFTIEGNSSDACKQRQYAVGDGTIYGYGVPGY